MGDNKLLQLDLDKIIRSRLSEKQNKRLPRRATAWLSRVFHIEELNEMLKYAFPKRGSAFSAKLMEYLGSTLEVEGLDRLPASGRYIFACNHPLGGMDGIALISALGKKFGDENISFLVNDMLMHVEPLADVFLPINKYGSQGRQAAKAINETYASEKQMLIFPAGLVSRLGKKGEIKDLEWQKAFVAKGREYKRDIVPVYFEGRNTDRFYKIAYWRKRLGIKINIEQTLLPSELTKSKSKRWRAIFGEPIESDSLLRDSRPAQIIACEIREKVYNLAERCGKKT